RFDGFGDFLVVDQALYPLHDFAITGNKKGGGVPEQAAEFVGHSIIAPQDRVVHRELLAVHVEEFFGGVRGDHVIAFIVHVDAKNSEALWRIFLLHFDEPGNFDLAGFAPRGPEIHEHYFALVLVEWHVLAVEVLEGDFERRWASDRVKLRTFGVDANTRGPVRINRQADEYRHGTDDQQNLFHFEFPRVFSLIDFIIITGIRSPG